MPEFKNGFEKARMNKDTDERLVPNGEYREANNIQISTSEGSNVGVAQNIAGNKTHATIDHTSDAVYNVPTTATCVASIAAADKDKIYYFVSAGDNNINNTELDICKDYILEYDVITEKTKYVFVDIYRVRTKIDGDVSVASNTFKIDDGIADSPDNTTTQNRTGIRIGMQVYSTAQGYDPNNNIFVTDIRYNSGWEITVNQEITWANDNDVRFEAPRVLNFSKHQIITGINILDDFIFWTDNYSEPKKINIPRSIAGTGGTEYLVGGGIAGLGAITSTSTTDDIFEGDTDYFHTRLARPITTSTESSPLRIVRNPDKKQAVYVQESNVTVIRPAPTQALHLDMVRTKAEGNTTTTYTTSNPFILNGELLQAQDVLDGQDGNAPQITFNSPVDYNVGDIILFTLTNSENAEGYTIYIGNAVDYAVRCEVIETPSAGESAGPYSLKILSIRSGLISTHDNWEVRLEEEESLFEYKFPRFSYRYKYIDGEYSPFAPFSQIAFLPDRYSYEPKDGYNFGMVNQLRELRLKYYHYDFDCIPEDIEEIDILYKETNNPAVFVVKTLKRSDGAVVWPDLSQDEYNRGSFQVKTDMIHAAVPSNQLLRPWDNVPRYALAQEVSANRLIYGNYVQNYTVHEDPVINIGLRSDERIEALNPWDESPVQSRAGWSEYALPSVKSLRTYQVGVTFSDRYGRETPILTGLNDSGLEPNSITVSKEVCDRRNRLVVNLFKETNVPSWAEYMTYYVKETSVEYYTLASDRWYAAEDGNVWLSFPSSERNKINEEEFIELKKSHGSNVAVREPARYKVLAIENEAPDDIRAARMTLGSVTNDASGPNGSIIGNSVGFGYPEENRNFFYIDSSEFEATFDEDEITSLTTTVVFSSADDDSRSIEYRVAGYNDAPQAGYKIINLTAPLGSDINFATDNILTVTISSLRLENLPEFDGRFFVKIARDTLLESYLGTSMENLTEEDLVLFDELNLGYLNNMGYRQEDYDPENGQVLPAAQEHEYSMAYNEVDGNLYPPSSVMEAIPAWITGSHNTDSRKYQPNEYTENWYDVAGQNQYEWQTTGTVTSTNIEDNPIREINDTDDMGNLPSSWNQVDPHHHNGRKFWKEIQAKCAANRAVFIDACTAYCWTSKHQDQPGNFFQGDDDGNELIPGASSWWWSMPIGANAWEKSEGHESQMPGNMNDNHGMPSRGIWANGEVMDLSFSGMGVGYPGEGSINPVDHTVQEHDNPSHNHVAAFMEVLTTPGTMFRFKNDPDPLTLSLYRVASFQNFPEFGYNNGAYFGAVDNEVGVYGIRNYWTGAAEGILNELASWLVPILAVHQQKKQYEGANMRQRWSVRVTSDKLIGDGPSGYSPVTGTNPDLVPPEDGNNPNFRRALHHDFSNFDAIQIYKRIDSFLSERGHFSKNPAVWETIPKESVDLDIYYQASSLIPLWLDDRTNEEVIPVGASIRKVQPLTTSTNADGDEVPNIYTAAYWSNHNTIRLTSPLSENLTAGNKLLVKYKEHYERRLVVQENATEGSYEIVIKGDRTNTDPMSRLHTLQHTLDWNNCWCFWNGVESDRIRDDFNAPQVDNGVRVTTGLSSQVKEERRKHGLIWSGIYNSNAGINDTNQFIMAESITKDLNPVYGSIQALLNRNTRLIMFCEDKILRAVTNRDALYNANGQPQLVASNAVVGDVQAYQGQYGIATNPESMAENPYAVYFTDAMRGKVLRLTAEGIVPISDVGMKDYFADLFRENTWRCLGTFDQRKNEYNLTISKKYTNTQAKPHDTKTVTYNDNAKGWVSFKSFIPQHGATINNNYYTFYDGQLYKHHDETSLTYYCTGASSTNLTMTTVVGLEINMLVTGTGIVDGATITNISGNVVTITNAVTSLFIPQDITFTTPKNRFYNVNYTSDITTVFNQNKDSIKSYQTIKYSGSKASIGEWDTQSVQWLNNNYASNDGLNVATNENDGEYYNLDGSSGWYVEDMTTDLQSSGSIYFKDKEGKYFGYVAGQQREVVNEKEFSVQGIGNATIAHDTSGYGGMVTVRVTNNTSSTYQGINADGSAASGGAWDDATTIASETDKWQCTVGTRTVEGGSDIGSSQTTSFTLSPIINGVYSGTPVAAENLEWSGATQVGDTTTWTNDADTHGDPYNTLHIETVAFTNTVAAGDPSNEVTVTVTFKSSLDWPTSDVIWYIDIDEKATKEPETEPELRDVGFEVHWPYYNTDNQVAPSVADLLSTETQIAAGSSTVDTQWKFTGSDILETGESYLIGKITFAAASNTHYSNGPAYTTSDLGAYADNYQVQFTDHVQDTNGDLIGFTARVYYTPGETLPTLVDPPNGEFLSTFGHTIYIDYIIKLQTSHSTNTISGVTHAATVNYRGGVIPVTVYGDSGAIYRLNIEKQEGTSFVDATSTSTANNGFFDFSTSTFTAAPDTTDFTIPASGKNIHYVSIPRLRPGGGDARYNVTLQASSTYTLASGVPTLPGDSFISQYGLRKLTLSTTTFHAGRYASKGTDITYVTPTSHRTSLKNPTSKKIVLLGGNGNSSKTQIILNNKNHGVKPGMRVIAETYDITGVDGTSPGGRTGGSGTTPTITHGTTVASVEKNFITLSSAFAVPDNTEITFVSGHNIVPFEFTITPSGGNTLSLQDSIELAKEIGVGYKGILTNGAVSNSRSVTLDNIKGVAVGDIVSFSGCGIKDIIKVATLNSSTSITLDKAITVADNELIAFKKPNNIELINASKILSGSNIVIRGHLRVNSLQHDVTVPILIDNIILTE